MRGNGKTFGDGIVKARRVTNGQAISDEEIWSAIHYLDPELRADWRGLIVFLTLFWIILALSALFLYFRLRP